MGSTTGSCGHKISDKWWNSRKCNVAYKEFTIDFDDDRGVINAVAYGVVCPKCKKNYEQWGVILYTKEEEQLWMENKLPYNGIVPRKSTLNNKKK